MSTGTKLLGLSIAILGIIVAVTVFIPRNTEDLSIFEEFEEPISSGLFTTRLTIRGSGGTLTVIDLETGKEHHRYPLNWDEFGQLKQQRVIPCGDYILTIVYGDLDYYVFRITNSSLKLIDSSPKGAFKRLSQGGLWQSGPSLDWQSDLVWIAGCCTFKALEVGTGKVKSEVSFGEHIYVSDFCFTEDGAQLVALTNCLDDSTELAFVKDGEITKTLSLFDRAFYADIVAGKDKVFIVPTQELFAITVDPCFWGLWVLEEGELSKWTGYDLNGIWNITWADGHLYLFGPQKEGRKGIFQWLKIDGQTLQVADKEELRLSSPFEIRAAEDGVWLVARQGIWFWWSQGIWFWGSQGLK